MKISDLYEARGLGPGTHGILARIKAARRDAAQPAVLVSIKKDGTESMMHDAKSYHASEDAARRKHADIVGLNPGRNIRHNLYVDGKLVGILDKDTLQEMASGGGTSSGAVASLANPFGIVMRQPSLFGYVPIAKKKRRKTRKKHSSHK